MGSLKVTLSPIKAPCSLFWQPRSVLRAMERSLSTCGFPRIRVAILGITTLRFLFSAHTLSHRARETNISSIPELARRRHSSIAFGGLYSVPPSMEATTDPSHNFFTRRSSQERTEDVARARILWRPTLPPQTLEPTSYPATPQSYTPHTCKGGEL